MDYKPAELTPEAVKQIQSLERDLSAAAGDNIVVIAYKQERDQSAGSPAEGGKES